MGVLYPSAMSGFNIQMPPALAGDNSEVSADADGASNLAAVTLGLTAISVAGAGAMYLTQRIVSVAGAENADNYTLTSS